MRFVKMHGLGNDYVYINGFTESLPSDPAARSAMAIQLADRHFGVGGDGMILLLPPEDSSQADLRMQMYNIDGSEGEMCGNGIRCVAKLAHDHGITSAKPMRIETGAGLLSLDYALDASGKVETVSVDMGEPILQPADVPVDVSELGPTSQPQTFSLPLEDKGQEVASEFVTATFVSMGNPHAVIFVPNLEAIDHHTLGPRLEHHPAFPNRMNVHFVQVKDEGYAEVVHWERGSGPTLACGTGACAVAGVLSGRTGRSITAKLPGGELQLEWLENNHVIMTGPATEVFHGEIELSL